MLQNAYILAKIGADTAENEQHFAEILPKTGNYPTGTAFLVRLLPLGAEPGEAGMSRSSALNALNSSGGGGGGAHVRTSFQPAPRWQNFGKMLLVFGCIGSDFCKKKYTSASR